MKSGGLNPIERAIVRYLSEHPDAADSELGVMQWWLPTLGRTLTIDAVRRALDALEARGAVRSTLLADGTRVFFGASSDRVES